MNSFFSWLMEQVGHWLMTDEQRELDELEALWESFFTDRRGQVAVLMEVSERVDRIWPLLTEEQRAPWNERGRLIYELFLCWGVQDERIPPELHRQTLLAYQMKFYPLT